MNGNIDKDMPIFAAELELAHTPTPTLIISEMCLC